MMNARMLGDSKGSVLDILDRTVTGAGARLLASRLSLSFFFFFFLFFLSLF
jgi:DNA mismatch repair ATPase MutS